MHSGITGLINVVYNLGSGTVIVHGQLTSPA